jgi:hypothetical protein
MAVAWLVVLVFIAVSGALLVAYDWFLHKQLRKDAECHENSRGGQNPPSGWN